MKQKLFFLMLTLFMLSAASVNAQVTIGADAPPHSSAVLDLQSDNLGFKLPVIELGDVSVFQLSGTATNADGIMIYNSSDATTGGSGKGIYVWEGEWIFVGKSAPVAIPVTRIKITSENYITKVDADGTLKLTATVEPATASNPSLIWSIVYNPATSTGRATIDQNGQITGVKPGNVTARATATDGSGVYVNFEFVVLATGVAESITVESATGATELEMGASLQLEAIVEPLNAYQPVVWSVDEGSEFASVSATGLVSGIAAGTALISATTAGDGTASGSLSVEVLAIVPVATVLQQIGNGTYETYNFQGVTWMVQNSGEGNYSYDHNDVNPSVPNYYYSLANAPSACPSDEGWYLPTYTQVHLLEAYMQSEASTGERFLFTNPSRLAGTYVGGIFENVGINAVYYIKGENDLRLITSTQTFYMGNQSTARQGSVRCVKPN
jgi:uncharacterized protein YjdB